MKVSVISFENQLTDNETLSFDVKPDLILYFGDGDCMNTACRLLQEAAPNAISLGCSSGGQIFNNFQQDPVFVAAAIEFSSTTVRAAICGIGGQITSLDAGLDIGEQLAADDLAGVIILSDGMAANGSDLAKGVSSAVGLDVPVFGGLAGDGDRFERTYVGLNGDMSSGKVAAVGLYGDDIHIGHGSEGGWRPFGPRRIVTKSKGNVLYELDGKPALDLYEKYLGEEAQDLPASALLFPLQISDPNVDASEITRTILNINREDKSLIFAGNMPEGYTAQLMKASHDGLLTGAAEAAATAVEHEPNGELAILVSCIGRRLVMKQRAEEEVEAAGEELGENMPRIGFYSYGEICPSNVGGAPKLHNQTMTISIISERVLA